MPTDDQTKVVKAPSDAVAQFRAALPKVQGEERVFVLPLDGNGKVLAKPSGDLTPSKADIAATKELKDLAARLGVVFLDHIILGSDDSVEGRNFVSLAEQGI